MCLKRNTRIKLMFNQFGNQQLRAHNDVGEIYISIGIRDMTREIKREKDS